jgi:hypothetical protein
MKIIRVHVAGMQNPGISGACQLGQSDPMGTSVTLILDRPHHVAHPDLTPSFAERDRTALADLPRDRRQKVSLLVKKLLVKSFTRRVTPLLIPTGFSLLSKRAQATQRLAPR